MQGDTDTPDSKSAIAEDGPLAALPAGDRDVFFAAVSLTRMSMTVTDPNRPDNPIVFANPAFLDLTGYTSDQVIGRNCRFLQGADTDPATLERVRDAVARRTPITVELLNYRADGSSFWNALFVAPVFAGDGRLRYFFASQLDITRRREAEAAVAQTHRREGLGVLAGGVAHEFNNLLTVINGNLEPLRRDATEDRTAIRLDRVRDATERAASLTRAMVAFARRQRLDDQYLDLAVLLRANAPMLQEAAGAACTLVVETGPGDALVWADAEQLQTALQNIVANARDAHPSDGRIVIRLLARDLGAQPPGEVELAVIDHGTGMAADVCSRAIEPFFTTKPPGAGVGLGLSMAYGFMRQSGGRLAIESEVGRGTTVRLCFRDRQPLPQSLPRAAPAETVLVVDDDRDLREEAVIALGGLGYAVVTAGDAREALALLQEQPGISLMVTDLAMPEMSGDELSNQALSLRPRLPILFTTGFPEREVPGSLAKPYSVAELAIRIRDLLDLGAGGPPPD